ncbi:MULTISPECIES: hypothetical protein [Pseudomonas]|jgi:hypothetical protein|uniref:Uncharacterized protein n=1 Tax=Pseudomonas gingeri TaxID=117681 RepID=A0A7Y8BJH4_9PSED|nr:MULTISPECIES: hypothetical protein [Pseudomonas]NWB45673.1 hypothetical protein [Pseudomonas gingeri]
MTSESPVRKLQSSPPLIHRTQQPGLSIEALRDRLLSADCVEKVGFGFHGRKVRV